MTSQPSRYVRIFRQARLIWVWTPETFRVDDPELRTPHDVAAALAAVGDIRGYRLGIDARHATVEGAPVLAEEMGRLELLGGPPVPNAQRAAFVADDYRTLASVRMIAPMVSASFEVELFDDLRRGLEWLGGPDTFSERHFEWAGSALAEQR